MSDSVDKEIEAIKTLLRVLEPLEPQVRESVLDYVLKRLNIKPLEIKTQKDIQQPFGEKQIISTQPEIIHIKDLKDKKKPKSAIEMAVLVAYYLSHLASKEDRKETISTKDIETYFKIADFQLPTQISFTLPNAKKAGYLDSTIKGEYKLNPVGYNLIVHSMPRAEQTSMTTRRKKKKVTKKKTLKSTKKIK